MQTQRRELNFKGQNVFIGIDLHLLSWTVSIFTERLFHKKFNQPPQADILRKYLDRNFPNATYYSVYEAGFVTLNVSTISSLLPYLFFNHKETGNMKLGFKNRGITFGFISCPCTESKLRYHMIIPTTQSRNTNLAPLSLEET